MTKNPHTRLDESKAWPVLYVCSSLFFLTNPKNFFTRRGVNCIGGIVCPATDPRYLDILHVQPACLCKYPKAIDAEPIPGQRPYGMRITDRGDNRVHSAGRETKLGVVKAPRILGRKDRDSGERRRC